MECSVIEGSGLWVDDRECGYGEDSGPIEYRVGIFQ